MSFIITTQLLPHQTKAVEKFNLLHNGEIRHLKVAGLFMEMGTGKTLSAIEMVRQRGDKISQTIWCCPVSIKETIRKEILKHTDTNPQDIYVLFQTL